LLTIFLHSWGLFTKEFRLVL